MSGAAADDGAPGGAGVDPFSAGTRYTMTDGSGSVDVLGWRLRLTRPEGRTFYDFTTHPLRELVVPYLLRNGTSGGAGTLNVDASTCARLGRFLLAAGRTDVTAQAYGELLEWLKRQPGRRRSREREGVAPAIRSPDVARDDEHAGETWAGDVQPGEAPAGEVQNGAVSPPPPPAAPPFLDELGQRATAELTVRLYTFGLSRRPPWPGWNSATREVMADACAARFLGQAHRAAREKRATAVTRHEFTRLLRAIRLELEACDDALAAAVAAGETALLAVSGRLLGAARGAERGGHSRGRTIDPNPFVCFALLAALEGTVRAAEFNALCRGDDTRRPGQLYLHARNKRPRYVPITPEMRRALDLALRWCEPLRPYAKDQSPLLLFSWGDPALTGQSEGERAPGVRRVASLTLNDWLARFYAKYFARTERRARPGDDAADAPADADRPEIAPVLYADPKTPGGPLHPLALAYADVRAAGLTDHSREERNKDVMRKRADHRSISTTERYYLEDEEEERLRTTARFLAPHSERLRMRMRGQVVAEPGPAERARLAARGALVPVTRGETPALGGHCHDAATSDEAAARGAGSRPGCARSGDCRLCEHFRIYVSRRVVYVASRDTTLARAAGLHANGGLREAENLRQSAALDQAIIDRIDEHQGGAPT